MKPTVRGRSKYGAIRTEIDGIRFDSKAEAAFYWHLKLLMRAGEVLAIERQPTFTLQGTFRKFDPVTGKVRTWRKRTYRADFRVKYADGRDWVIDVKGVRTETFILKQCLFEALYPNLHLVLVSRTPCGGWRFWS